ncbi:MAG: lytic transglycosylase domain-containing protein [Bryobacteraceae bacterium]
MRYLPFAILTLSCVTVFPCFGKEAVYLRTGFRLEVDSHTRQDQKFVLATGSGTLELPVADVDRIEVLPDIPDQAVAAIPAAVPDQQPEELLTKAAKDLDLPPEFVRSVAKVESGFRQGAVSRKGALGLMQLMPSTAAELGVNPKHAQENARGGAKYLRDLLVRYRGDSALALAAYNAGPGAVSKFHGVPPYSETRHYVLQVLREYERQKSSAKTVSAAEIATANKPISTN